jgi:hypothetical protein
MVDGEWSYSMLPFQGERKGQRLFSKGKGACEMTLGFHAEGPLEDAAAWRWPIVGVGRHQD